MPPIRFSRTRPSIGGWSAGAAVVSSSTKTSPRPALQNFDVQSGAGYAIIPSSGTGTHPNAPSPRSPGESTSQGMPHRRASSSMMFDFAVPGAPHARSGSPHPRRVGVKSAAFRISFMLMCPSSVVRLVSPIRCERYLGCTAVVN